MRARFEIRDATLLFQVEQHINFSYHHPAGTVRQVVEQKIKDSYYNFERMRPHTAQLPTLAQCLAARYTSPTSGLSAIITGRLCAMGRGDLLYVVNGYPVGSASTQAMRNTALERASHGVEMAREALEELKRHTE